MDKKKELINNTMIFGIGVLGAKLIQFLLVPLYTNYMHSAEYSVSDIISSTVTLLMPILTLGMAHGIIRFSISRTNGRKTLLILSFTTIVIGTIILFLLIPLFSFTKLFDGYELSIPILFFVTSFRSILSNYCKAIDKNKEYAFAGFFSAIIVALLSWLFLGFFSLGVQGYLWAIIISHAITSVYFLLICNIFSTLKKNVLQKAIIGETLKYSIPLILNDIGWWIIQVSDRYMITLFCGAEINGVYAIAYKIPGIFNIIVSIFNQAFSLSAFKECDINNRDQNGKYNGVFFESIYKNYNTVIFFSASLVILIAQPIAAIIINNEFFDSWHYTIFLMIAFAFEGLEAYFSGIIAGIKKTHILFFSTSLGAIVNIAINAIMIPHYQAYGAIIGTISGYLVVTIIRYLGVKKYVSMKMYEFKSIISIVIIFLEAILYNSSYIIVRCFSIICFSIIILIHIKTLKYLFKELLYKVFKHNK